MADIVKLKKQVLKARENADARKQELHDAIDRYGEAAGIHAAVREELENAEALEMARDLRGKRAAE